MFKVLHATLFAIEQICVGFDANVMNDSITYWEYNRFSDLPEQISYDQAILI